MPNMVDGEIEVQLVAMELGPKPLNAGNICYLHPRFSHARVILTKEGTTMDFSPQKPGSFSGPGIWHDHEHPPAAKVIAQKRMVVTRRCSIEELKRFRNDKRSKLYHVLSHLFPSLKSHNCQTAADLLIFHLTGQKDVIVQMIRELPDACNAGATTTTSKVEVALGGAGPGISAVGAAVPEAVVANMVLVPMPVPQLVMSNIGNGPRFPTPYMLLKLAENSAKPGTWIVCKAAAITAAKATLIVEATTCATFFVKDAIARKKGKISSRELGIITAKNLGGASGSIMGSSSGAALGTLVPGAGTVVGAIVGGCVGGWLGQSLALKVCKK